MIKKKKKEQTKLPILGMREHYYRIKKKRSVMNNFMPVHSTI